MGKLSNHKLREDSMREFLNKMGISTEEVDISSIEGLFSYQFEDREDAEFFLEKMIRLLYEDSDVSIETLLLSEILSQELSLASCLDTANEVMHRISCNAIMQAIQSQSLNSELLFKDGEVECILPNESYASLLRNLDYPNIRFTSDNKMLINVQAYLHEQSQGLVMLQGLNLDAPPMMLLATKTLESKKVFFHTEQLSSGKQKVTPYIFVPEYNIAQHYSFMLDISGSMRKNLNRLKKSVFRLAEQLFDFQPNATIELATFNHNIVSCGTFSYSERDGFIASVEGLEAEGGTALYDAAANRIREIFRSGKNNHVLFFTDGEERGSKHYNDSGIREMVDCDAPLLQARNKFYLINFNTDCNATLREVVAYFHSQVIDTTDADFVGAMSDPKKLKEWAASRELFTATYVMEAETDQEILVVQSNAIDLSGQVASFDAKIIEAGKSISLSITDGDGNLVAEGLHQNSNHVPSMGYLPGLYQSARTEAPIKDESDGLSLYTF